MTFIKFYVLAFVIFFLMDMVWLGIIAKDFYHKEIGHLMAPKFNLIPAAFFYLIYIGGLSFFAILPAFEEESLKLAILYGALFGFVSYATYDLTNLATLKGWPVKIVIYDLVWGTFVSGIASMSSLWIGSHWKNF